MATPNKSEKGTADSASSARPPDFGEFTGVMNSASPAADLGGLLDHSSFRSNGIFAVGDGNPVLEGTSPQVVNDSDGQWRALDLLSDIQFGEQSFNNYHHSLDRTTDYWEINHNFYDELRNECWGVPPDLLELSSVDDVIKLMNFEETQLLCEQGEPCFGADNKVDKGLVEEVEDQFEPPELIRLSAQELETDVDKETAEYFAKPDEAEGANEASVAVEKAKLIELGRNQERPFFNEELAASAEHGNDIVEGPAEESREYDFVASSQELEERKKGDSSDQQALLVFEHIDDDDSFPKKIFKLLADKKYENILSWDKGGESFTITSLDLFSTYILGPYFNGNKFTTFKEKLRRNGFKRIGVNRYKRADFQQHNKKAAYAIPTPPSRVRRPPTASKTKMDIEEIKAELKDLKDKVLANNKKTSDMMNLLESVFLEIKKVKNRDQ